MKLLLLYMCLPIPTAHAQSALPQGCYQVVASSGSSRYDLMADTLRCERLPDAPQAPRWSGDPFCILQDELEHQTSGFSVDPPPGEYLSHWGSMTTPIQIVQPSRGKSWYMPKFTPSDARYFWQVADTLWFCRLLGGELPIDFAKGSTEVVDSSGLRLMATAIGATAKQGRYAVIDIYVQGPAEGSRNRRARLAKARMQVVEALLRDALGAAYALVRYVEVSSPVDRMRYTVRYRVR